MRAEQHDTELRLNTAISMVSLLYIIWRKGTLIQFRLKEFMQNYLIFSKK